MKKRWMKSIIEISKRPAPALPFQRQVRYEAKNGPSALRKTTSA